MRFYTAADVVGAGQAVALSTLFTQTYAKELVFGITAGSGPARFGDSNAGASRGVPIPASVQPLVLRTTVADVTDQFSLALHYVYVPNGTTLSVSIGC